MKICAPFIFVCLYNECIAQPFINLWSPSGHLNLEMEIKVVHKKTLCMCLKVAIATYLYKTHHLVALSWHKGSCQGISESHCVKAFFFSVKAYFQETTKERNSFLQKEAPWESGHIVNLRIIIFSSILSGRASLTSR